MSTFHLMNAERVIADEIAAKATRLVVARSYALALRSDYQPDWGAINRMIIDRWSLSGLEYIKKMAWSGKCFDGASK